jgi:hypothetical protein
MLHPTSFFEKRMLTVYKIMFVQEEDFREMVADSFILTHMGNKGAFPNSARTDNQLAPKHAVAQQDMHAVGLTVHAGIALQKEDQLTGIKDHGAQTIEHSIHSFQNLCTSSTTGETEVLGRNCFGGL